jgi:pyruvate ferredoxin oxidoreductase gamma subunit/2-oxoisovalerate ferredoxin oxidoreductase gamma subunit
LSKNDILIRTNVYNPDHVVVQDRTLIQSIDFARGLRSGGWILINSPAPPANLTPFAGFRLAFVDASHIARNHKLGTRTSPIVNTSMIGAFASILDIPPIESVVSSIREEITIEAERNVQAAKDAYREVRILGMIEQGLEK